MKKNAAETNPLVIDSPVQAPDWDAWGDSVRKIVVGQPPIGGEKQPLRLATLPDDLATRFPELTHLHLWQITGLRALPTLPDGLKCLDLRGCADLTGLPRLPDTLETLVLDGCGELSDVPSLAERALPGLVDLSLRGCGALAQDGIAQLLGAAPALRRFDGSDCPQLSKVWAWPSRLERIDLNGCPGLSVLPEHWPAGLRRLGLRGASQVKALTDLPESLDYLDLAFTPELSGLPGRWGRPRTLFLYGSGLLMPPASEHGRDEEENVALRTRAYFEDVERVGPGEVKRCKILFLGNGAAGKTCLALRLVGRDPTNPKPPSTHGVQFWERTCPAVVGSVARSVQEHLWDFGGQEIYHNTHRLFMGTGAVFVVVWNPEEKDSEPPADDAPYRDVRRPLQYWLDLIRLACPHQPRIALVCSRRSARTPRLEAFWRSKVRPADHGLPCYYFDSCEDRGQKGELENWLREAVGEVVKNQGVVVPVHWEIAQDLVQGWVRKMQADPAFAAHHNQMSPERFGELLDEAIAERISAPQGGPYPKLKESREARRFDLDPDRLRRTLGFLTHSGWLYWDERLFESRVIVGQRWALDGIYTVLDRSRESRVYRELRAAGGQFTRRQLHDWVWKDRYTEDEQRLLISFMKAVDVCFELVPERDSWWREAVFNTFEHLPTSERLGLPAITADRKGVQARAIDCPRLHKGHWHRVLKKLGERYGTDGRYAADGFLLQNHEGQTIRLGVEIGEGGLGGCVRVQVAGPKAAERLESMSAFVLAELPVIETAAPGSTREPRAEASGDPAGTPPGLIQVFVSYTWDSDRQEIPTNYEKPVDALCAALEGEPVRVLRDKTIIQGGDSITAFMQRVREVDRLIVVHSDKYWASPFCMYELWTALERLKFREITIPNFLVLIEHTNSGFGDSAVVARYHKKWAKLKSIPTMLLEVTTPEKLRIGVGNLLLSDLPRIAALADRNRKWDDARAAELIAWVKERIGLRLPGSNS